MKNADMPAMPVIAEYTPDGKPKVTFAGLSKREMFAAMAMQGLLACPEVPQKDPEETYANALSAASVSYADALLAALEPKP